MFYNSDSGLYLTKYRAYDSMAGRRLSRDPIGESIAQIEGSFGISGRHGIAPFGTPGALKTQQYGLAVSGDLPVFKSRINLYDYVSGNPILRNDPKGDQWTQVIIGIGAILIGIYEIRPTMFILNQFHFLPHPDRRCHLVTFVLRTTRKAHLHRLPVHIIPQLRLRRDPKFPNRRSRRSGQEIDPSDTNRLAGWL